MSPMIRFILAMIHGMGGPNLEKWISDLPSALGEELGKLIRACLTAENQLTLQGEKQIAEWLGEHQRLTRALFASFLWDSGVEERESESLLEKYLEVLNTVVAVARKVGRPLILRAFLHDNNCLTYWHFDPQLASALKDFAREPLDEIILCQASQPKIFILDGPATEECIKDLNIAIRKAQHRQLDASLYAGKLEVRGIREFEIQLGSGYRNESKVAIPLGAPGLVDLLASVPLALAAQRFPQAELAKTLAKLQRSMMAMSETSE